MPEPSLSDLMPLIQRRRATRRFTDRDVPDTILDELLEAARWAPSGYNLQPTHFVVVRDAARRDALRAACMDQAQVAEAPAVVVFCGDKHVAYRHFEHVIRHDKEAGAIDEEYEALLRKFVPLAFHTHPLGLNWSWKAALLPLVRYVAPVPSLPAVRRRYWLAKQAALAAMNFMLAATAAGLATCPMEGFDERRLSRLLKLPRSILPIIVVPVGYAADNHAIKTRLPMEHLVHRETW